MPEQRTPCQVLILLPGQRPACQCSLQTNVSLEWQVVQCGELKKLSQAFTLRHLREQDGWSAALLEPLERLWPGFVFLLRLLKRAGLSRKNGLDMGCQCLCQDTKDTGFTSWTK